MGLPSTGSISMSQVRNELELSGAISLGQSEVRSLADRPSGSISMSHLRGKSAWNPNAIFNIGYVSYDGGTNWGVIENSYGSWVQKPTTSHIIRVYYQDSSQIERGTFISAWRAGTTSTHTVTWRVTLQDGSEYTRTATWEYYDKLKTFRLASGSTSISTSDILSMRGNNGARREFFLEIL